MDPHQANSDGQDLLNVSGDSNPPSGKPDKKLGTSNFFYLLGTKDESYYIDKTNLKDVFLQCGCDRVLVTAPRRFGKTVNLAMLHAFFELQVPAEESKTLSEEQFQIKTVRHYFPQKERYFITGISHISGMGLSGSNVVPFRFLEDHPFIPCYGLTTREIRQLSQTTYGFDEERIAETERKCNGYSTTSGVKIYNTWSVLEYASQVEEDEATYEWQDTGYIVGLPQAFRFPVIMEIIQTKLLLNDPIEIENFKCFRVEDVLELVNIIRNVDSQNVEYPHPELFFSFLLEQGYLSFVPNKPGLLVIPNEQIREQINEKLTHFKTEVFGGDHMFTENCRVFFLSISKTKCDHDDFKKFQVNLEAVLQKYAATWIKKNEENVRCTIKILLADLGFKDCAELVFKFEDDGVENKRKIDCLIIKDDFFMIFGMKYKESNKKAMLCIKEKDYLKLFNGDKHG